MAQANSWGYVVFPEGVCFPQIPQKPNIYRSQIASGLVSAGWQERFDELWLSTAEATEAQFNQYSQLKKLTSEFCAAATNLTTKILDDVAQPEGKRQFQPLQKLYSNFYFSDGILVEFCSDAGLGIYGGDHGANKAATRQMVALQCLLDAKIPGICLPLMCCVDLYGSRAICSALIPKISESTIVYGWKNDAKEFALVDKEFNGKIERACRSLRLRAHNIVGRTGLASTIYGPADMEGHVVLIGHTKKYYLLNFERLMPPVSSQRVGTPIQTFVFPKDGGDILEATIRLESVSKFLKEYDITNTVPVATAQGLMYSKSVEGDQINSRASHLVKQEARGTVVILQNVGSIFYELHRPESLQLYSAQLVKNEATLDKYKRCSLFSFSSDAFSGFGCCQNCLDPNAACSHGAALLHKSAQHLGDAFSHQLVPLLSNRINLKEIRVVTSENLIDELHRHGLHLKLMGMVGSSVTIPSLNELLTLEMVARCVRHYLRSEQKQAVSSENGLKHVTLNIFNAVIGEGIDADKFWDIRLPKLMLYFSQNFSVYRGEMRFNMSVPAVTRPTDKAPLFLRIIQLCGVKFTEAACVRVCTGAYNRDIPFISSDILDFVPQVKGPNFNSRLESLTNALASESRGASTHRERYHELVLKAFGSHHPFSITSFAKLSLEFSRRHLHDDAVVMGRKALEICLAVYGPFSHHEAVVLTTLGDIAQVQNRNTEALSQYRAALRVAFVLFGDKHALVGKLCSRIGRLEIKLGDKKLGLQCLGRGYSIYKELYGDLCDYLTPTVTMGKGEEIASVLNQLLRATRDATPGGPLVSVLEGGLVEIKQNAVVGLEAGKALAPSAICERITKSIQDIEEVEGLERGYLLETDTKAAMAEEPVEWTANPLVIDTVVSCEWEGPPCWPQTVIAGDMHRFFLRSATPVSCILSLVEEADQALPITSSVPQPYVSKVEGTADRYCITLCPVIAGKFVLNITRTEEQEALDPISGSKLAVPLTVLPSVAIGFRSTIRLTQEGTPEVPLIAKIVERDLYGNYLRIDYPGGANLVMQRWSVFVVPYLSKREPEFRTDAKIVCPPPERHEGNYAATVPASIVAKLGAGIEYIYNVELKSNYRCGFLSSFPNPLILVGSAPETICKAPIQPTTQTLATICNSCHLKRGQSLRCSMCSGTLPPSATLRVPARYCHMCSIAWGKKCFTCKIFLNSASQCLYVCKSCSTLPRCVGLKRSVLPPPKPTPAKNQ